jgi:hypothetical protein
MLLPAVFYLFQLNSFGRIEYDDYYGILPQVMDGTHLSRSPLRWLLLKSNEHSVTLPAVAFALNAWATSGDNRALSALAVVLLLGVTMLLWRSLPRVFFSFKALRAAGPLLLSGLLLSPAGAYSVVMGFSGVIWFMSIAFSVLAIVLLRRGAKSRSLVPMGAVIVAGWASVLSFGTGLFLWPALVVGAAIYRMPWRRLIALCAGAVVPYAFAALTYVRPPGHPGLHLAKPWLLVEFFAVYLGSFLAANRWAAGVIGLAGLAGAGLLAVVFLRDSDAETADELAPWAMLVTYAVGNAVGTAVARATLGGARSSRYAPVAALFWIGLLVIACALAWRAADRRDPSRPVGLLVPTLCLLAPLAATWWRGLPIFAGWVERATWQGIAELALTHGVYDPDVLEAVSVAPREAFSQRAFLARCRQVPFERPPSAPVHLDGPAAGESAAPCPTFRARVTTVHPVDGDTARVEGVLEGEAPPVPELLVVDGEGRLRGVLRVLPTPALLARIGVPGGRAVRWAGYLRPAGSDDPVRIFWRGPGGGERLCPVSDPWQASDRWPGPSLVGVWKQPLGLRQNTP